MPRMPACCMGLIVLVLLGGFMPARLAAEEYMSQEAFLRASFADAIPDASRLWLDKSSKADIKSILGHDYQALRIRYWKQGERSAWILDEVGKEQPITVGVTITADRIARIDVLAFRESRGWEIRHGYFTEQFRSASLLPSLALDRPIDGITGATLSVRAVTKVARLALYLNTLTKNP